MFIVVSYDIESNRTRTCLAKRLKDFGPRVQKSVFEADIDDGEYKRLCELLGQVRLGDADSIRLYRLCAGCVAQTAIWGVGEVSTDKDYYIT